MLSAVFNIMHAIIRGLGEIDAMVLKIQKMPCITPSIVNSDQQVSSAMTESIDTYQTSPDQEKAFYDASPALQGQVTSQKHSKEELVKAHFKNLELLQNSKPANKELILPTAYSPSSASLSTLQKV
jgi:hypothetical protein